MAPSSVVTGLRVVIDLSDIYSTPDPIYNRCWCFVPFNEVKSIKHLRKHVRRRFNVPRSVSFTLLLDGYALWRDEPIHVLRDNDILVVRKTELVNDESNGIVTDFEALSTKGATPTPHETSRQPEKITGLNDLYEIHRKPKKRRRKLSNDSEQILSISPFGNGSMEEPVHSKNGSQQTEDVSVPTKKPKIISSNNYTEQRNTSSDIKTSDDVPNNQDPDKSVKTDVPRQNRPGRKRKRSRSKGNKETNNSQLSKDAPSETVFSRWATPLQTKPSSQSRHIRFGDECALNPSSHTPEHQFHSSFPHEDLGEDKQETDLGSALCGEVQFGQDVAQNNQQDAVDDDTLQLSDSRSNPTETVCKDYSSLPNLVGPPRVGDHIAFQELELTEAYTPEISEYREAVVHVVDFDSGTVDLKLTKPLRVATNGKFSMEDNDDENPGFQLVTQKSLLLTELLNAKLI